MIRKILLAIVAIVVVNVAFTQVRELNFTGRLADGSYIRVDSVKITNASRPRPWTQTLFAPDTVLTFGSNGISAAQSAAKDIYCFPNPAAGKTTVSVPSDESCAATLQLFDLAGHKVYEQNTTLDNGDNAFELFLPGKSVYLFAIVAKTGVRTVKVINSVSAGKASIARRQQNFSVTEKRQNTQIFSDGDSLVYAGFATYNGKKLLSRTIRQRQRNSETINLVFVPAIQGMLDGVFSVSANEQVRFSQGNLQWTSTGTHTVAGNGTKSGTWRFATNQYDTIGVANVSASSSYTGWIDLFGWGTSGYANCEPYERRNHSSYYADTVVNLNVTNYDWGKYNAISNGGNRPGLWRAIKKAEFQYLLSSRSDAASKWAMGSVKGILGLILLPDVWSLPAGLTFNPGFHNPGTATFNSYTTTQWGQMETAGAVFLPAAGIYSVSANNSFSANQGVYWMADRFSVNSNPGHVFFASAVSPDFNNGPFGSGVSIHNGSSVRLVQTY